MRGGKVQPSDDNERQAEQENDDFAALCHSGERSLTCLGASKKPKSRTSCAVIFQRVGQMAELGRKDTLSAETLHQSGTQAAK